MSQSSFLVGMALAGFLLFLAAKGRLSAYTAVLWGSPQAASKSGGSGAGLGSAISTAAHVAQAVELFT